MHVLVVDDSATIRKRAREILEQAGHTCDEAENGLEAIKMALSNRYDLIITDIVMPVLDGLKFIQRIRASRNGEDVPILILSSRGDEETVLRARDLRVQGYVLKPLRPDVLLDRVQRIRPTTS